jgi:hypothetical protein
MKLVRGESEEAQAKASFACKRGWGVRNRNSAAQGCHPVQAGRPSGRVKAGGPNDVSSSIEFWLKWRTLNSHSMCT